MRHQPGRTAPAGLCQLIKDETEVTTSGGLITTPTASPVLGHPGHNVSHVETAEGGRKRNGLVQGRRELEGGEMRVMGHN